MRASTLWNPNALRVMSRIFVLNDSTSALLRPVLIVAMIAERCSRILLASDSAPLRPGHPSVESCDGSGSRPRDRNAQSFF
jgi:hypothetical protein